MGVDNQIGLSKKKAESPEWRQDNQGKVSTYDKDPKVAAAKNLGIDLSTLYRKLKRYEEG